MVRIPPVEKRFKKGVSGNPSGRPIIPEKMLFTMTMAFLILVLKACKKDKDAQKTLLNIKRFLNLEKYERP
ncbi:MAG: hypothetical protein FWG57_09165 [Endomicrobia bacterium]|nr:hypothetical protein [Endomicrobiia bacterium]